MIVVNKSNSININSIKYDMHLFHKFQNLIQNAQLEILWSHILHNVINIANVEIDDEEGTDPESEHKQYIENLVHF